MITNILSTGEVIQTTSCDAAVPPLLFAGTKICYACRNGVTGTKKECYACRQGHIDKEGNGDIRDDGEEWYCDCSPWECECKTCTNITCPICGDKFDCSEYLNTVFKDERILWLANMVTHYRHDHRVWDRSHGYISRRYGQETYEQQKQVINEQAKRQIIRKCTKVFAGAQHN